MVDARQQQEMHCGQEEVGSALGQRSLGDQVQHVGLDGHAAADGGIGDRPVVLARVGEGGELVGQGLLGHGQKLAGSKGVTAVKKA